MQNISHDAAWLEQLYTQYPTLMPGLIHFGPLIGILLALFLVVFGLRAVKTTQKNHLGHLQKKEAQLQKREKLGLASDFARELTENRIKCEAFITIYSELLRSLRHTEQRAPYEDTGDSIHQYPPLSRRVFDHHMEQLSVFGPRLAGDLANAYAAVRSDPQYYTLEPTMPRSAAIRIVEMILDDAQHTLEPLDSVISALNVIIRDGEKRD